MKSKTCVKCKEEKPLNEYPKRWYGYLDPNGQYPLDEGRRYRGKCAACYNEGRGDYRNTNNEKVNEWKRNYREANRDKINAWNRAYYQANRARVNASSQKYMESEKGQAKRQEYNQSEQRKTTRNKWTKERLRTNLQYRISNSLRSRVYAALKGINKSASTLELLGCSIDELKEHFEAHFQDGMTWENYGEWHIDHIRPFASFDLTDPEQQRACCNWKNLQPLWAKENRCKGASLV